MSLRVPSRVIANCSREPARGAWLGRLPETVHELRDRWSLDIGPPFDGPEVSAAWVAPVRRRDGTNAVLKVNMPHMEADQEAAGLRFWNGRPTVRLLEADDALGAMLLERCEPGTWLRTIAEEEQDVVVGRLLRELWRAPKDPHPFRSLSTMIDAWVNETRENEERWRDPVLVREGLAMFERLARDGTDGVLLSTDLHAGNVLRAQRRPWLVIDPKPFVGDRTYDATQHLLNCTRRMKEAPTSTIERFAGFLDVDPDRVRAWLFARAAAENRDDWNDEWSEIARRIAP